MFLKKIDFLSPDITLYHKGDHSHSSWMSGILSLIQVAIMILVGIYYFLELINHKEPKAYFYSRFVEDAGFYPVNSSSLFHFISIATEKDSVTEYDFDFLTFRAIGIDTYYVQYLDNQNLSNFNHWIYGKCGNPSDIKEIEPILAQTKLKNFDNFNNFACIVKYYDSQLGKYYRIGEEKFRWPNISFGLANPERKFYSILVDRCSQETLDEIFGKGKYRCNNNENLKSLADGNHALHFNFINQDVDVLNYKEPNRKYIYSVENAIDKDNYSINHINLDPVLIITHDGIAFDNSKEKMTYTFERNDEFTYHQKDTNIYCIYNLWLKNRMQCFDRTYKKLQDVISNIGGVAQGITYITVFLNCLFNKYTAVSNVEKIIFPYLKIEDTYKKSSKNIKMDELNKKVNKLERNTNKKNNFEINCPTAESKTPVNNNDDACIDETSSNKYKNNETQIISKEDNLKAHYKYLFEKKFNFWYYRLYKLTCGKKNKYFKEFEDLRIKIISEENIIKNHLNILNLLIVNEISQINRNFCLKDLVMA